jgi:3-deoxy-D-manno-octulosonate 8-phosphate phosphatase (KDO 8-P phosphatase)
MKAGLKQKLARVRLVICDVDGVMTDGTVWMGNGFELKRFHIRDGLGLKFLQRHGIRVGWVSRRPSGSTQQRADDLKIDFVIQSDSDKVEAVNTLLRETGLNWSEVCFVGDDVVDLGAMQHAGAAVAVGDGVAEVKETADYVTKAPGGQGAVRETAELILKAQGKWSQVLAEYAK